MAAKMNALEVKFQEGLDKLKQDYLRPKSSDAVSEGESSFEIRFRNFETEIRASLEALRQDLKAINREIDNAKVKDDKAVRVNNLNKLIIRGLPEKDNATLLQEVCEVVNKQIGVKCENRDIKCCYRLGKPNKTARNTCRPIIVDFVCRWKRDEIFYAKKTLKGSSLVVCEVLTSAGFSLFQKIRKEFEAKNVWTNRGNIIVYTMNKKHYVNSEEDLLKLLNNS